MVSTHDEWADAETAQPDGHSSPPPTLAQVIASIRESRDEQTELLRLLVINSNRDGTVIGNARDQARISYVKFLATQPSLKQALSPSLSSSAVQRVRRRCLQPSSY
jgi:hypothetical protein